MNTVQPLTFCGCIHVGCNSARWTLCSLSSAHKCECCSLWQDAAFRDSLRAEIQHGFNEYVFIPICVVKHQKNEVLMWSQSVHLSTPTCSPDRAAANFITAVNIHALPPGQVILSLRTNNSSDPKCTLESIMFCSSVKNVTSFTIQ